MNIQAKAGQVPVVKLYQHDKRVLEEAQGLCLIISRNLVGERAGEAASQAADALSDVRTILTAEVPAKLVSK